MGLFLGIFLLRSPRWMSGERRVRLPIDGEAMHGDVEVVSSSPSGTTPTGPGLRKVPTNKFSPLPPLPLPNRPENSIEPAANRDIAHTNGNTKNATSAQIALPRTIRHWIWWTIRAAALIAAIVFFVVLIKSFYSHHSTECHWCRYLSCLPVNNWCEIGDLTFVNQ